MVVCKFFQQGYCRYGQSCRFEHIYGSKYTYHATTTPVSQPVHNQNPGVTDEQLVNQVQTDIQSALNGGQWILSRYTPFKGKHDFPDIRDLSPEEARLFIYEAKVHNRLDEAVAYINNLSKETRQKYEQLLQPNTTMVRVIRSLFNGENPSSPFTTTVAASSIFRNAVQGTSSVFTQNSGQSIFSPQGMKTEDTAAKSVFAQAAQNTFKNHASPPQNIFGPSQPTPSPSPFGQAPSNNPNIFGQNNTAQSIFAQANKNVFGQTQMQNSNQNTSTNVFAAAVRQASSPSDPFGQQKAPNDPFKQQPVSTDPFGQQKSPFSPTSIFQTTNKQPAIGGNIFEQQANTNETGIFSKEEELSADDLEAFKSNSFKLGFVPEVAPPRSLCV